MADNVLTRAEMEVLLAATPQPAPASSPAPHPRPIPPEADPAAILPYARPTETLLAEELRAALTDMHERCARQFAAELSSLVRRAAHVKLASIGEATCRQWSARLDSPTCLNLLSAAPLAGKWVLEIEPAILYPLIDCMLGGGCDPAGITRRPMTEIETRLATRVSQLLLGELTTVWRNAVELELAIERVECDPRLLPCATSGDRVVWLRFEVQLAAARGCINLAVPMTAVAIVADMLTEAQPSGKQQPEAPQHPSDTVELVACLADTNTDDFDPASLAVGDIIATEHHVDQPLVLLHDGVPKFHATVGAQAGCKALAITEVLSAGEASAGDTRGIPGGMDAT